MKYRQTIIDEIKGLWYDRFNENEALNKASDVVGDEVEFPGTQTYGFQDAANDDPTIYIFWSDDYGKTRKCLPSIEVEKTIRLILREDVDSYEIEIFMSVDGKPSEDLRTTIKEKKNRSVYRTQTYSVQLLGTDNHELLQMTKQMLEELQSWEIDNLLTDHERRQLGAI